MCLIARTPIYFLNKLGGESLLGTNSMPNGTATVADMGALAVSLTANILDFQKKMQKALDILKQFREQAEQLSGKIGISFQQVGEGVSKGTTVAAKQLSVVQDAANKTRERMTEMGKQVKKSGKEVVDVVDEIGKTVTTRGRQGAGAMLSFAEGVKRFVALNLRWFLVWRTLWALWGQILKGMKEFQGLLQETALALRTGTENVSSWVEQQILGIRIQREAIAMTMRHAIVIKDYVKSWYYLTTAGISAANAFDFVNTAVQTSIALDETSETTVRLLTGLYNVFGETITKVSEPLEKFNYIAAILTETFRRQDIELADYAKALPYVAEQWKVSGGSLEVLVAALGVMGTHFMRGSKAATSLARSLSVMMKYPERFAELTGMMFDPKKPLDYVQAIRAIRVALQEGEENTKTYGIAIEAAGDLFHLTGIRGARAALTLIDAFEMWEAQIIKNMNASYELVEAMAALAETTIPKQWERFGNILRGWVMTMVMAATNTSDFAEGLKRLNDGLERMTGFFETLGRLLRMFVGDFRAFNITIIAGLLAWRNHIGMITSSLGTATTTVGLFGLRMQAMASSILASWKTSAKAGQIVVAGAIRSTLGVIGTGFKDLGRVIWTGMGKISESFIGRFMTIYASMQLIFGYITLAHELMNKTFVQNSIKYGLELEMTEKTRWQRLAGFISDILRPAQLFQRGWARQYQVAYREFEKDRRAVYENYIKLELKTRAEAEEAMLAASIKWWEDQLGVQLDGQQKLQLATDLGLRKRFESMQAFSKWMEEEWPRLYAAMQKIQLDAMTYELWALDKQYKEEIEKTKGGKEALLRVEEWYAIARNALLRKYEREALEEAEKRSDRLEKARMMSFDKEITKIRERAKEAREAEAEATLQRQKVILERAADEAKVDRKAYEEIADIRAQFHNKQILEMEAFSKMRTIAEREGWTELEMDLKEGAEALVAIRERGLIEEVKRVEVNGKKILFVTQRLGNELEKEEEKRNYETLKRSMSAMTETAQARENNRIETIQCSEELSAGLKEIEDKTTTATEVARRVSRSKQRVHNRKVEGEEKRHAKANADIRREEQDDIKDITEKAAKEIQKVISANEAWIRKETERTREFNMAAARKVFDKRVAETEAEIEYIKSLKSKESETLEIDRKALEDNLLKMQNEYAGLRIKSERYWQQKWAQQDAEFQDQRFEGQKTEWERELTQFDSFYVDWIETLRKRQFEIAKAYDTAGIEIIQHQEKLREDIISIEKMKNRDLREIAESEKVFLSGELTEQEKITLKSATTIKDGLIKILEVRESEAERIYAEETEKTATEGEKIRGQMKNVYDARNEDLQAFVAGHQSIWYSHLAEEGLRTLEAATETRQTLAGAMEDQLSDFDKSFRKRFSMTIAHQELLKENITAVENDRTEDLREVIADRESILLRYFQREQIETFQSATSINEILIKAWQNRLSEAEKIHGEESNIAITIREWTRNEIAKIEEMGLGDFKSYLEEHKIFLSEFLTEEERRTLESNIAIRDRVLEILREELSTAESLQKEMSENTIQIREDLRSKIALIENGELGDLRKFIEEHESELLKFLDEEEIAVLKQAVSAQAIGKAHWDSSMNTMKAGLAAFEENLGTYKERSIEIWKDIAGITTGTVSTLFDDLLAGHKMGMDYLGELWQSFLDRLRQRFVDFMAEDIVDSFIELLTGKVKKGKGFKPEELVGQIMEMVTPEGTEFDIEEGSRHVGKAKMPKITFPEEPTVKVPSRAGKAIGIGVAEPAAAPGAPIQLSVVNLFDPNLMPDSMMRNKDVLINLITADVLEKGSAYEVIRGAK